MTYSCSAPAALRRGDAGLRLTKPFFDALNAAWAPGGIDGAAAAAAAELPSRFPKVTVVFHGTAEANQDSILLENLDPTRRRGQSMGPGEYTATRPGATQIYNGGSSRLLVFLVVVDPAGITVRRLREVAAPAGKSTERSSRVVSSRAEEEELRQSSSMSLTPLSVLLLLLLARAPLALLGIRRMSWSRRATLKATPSSSSGRQLFCSQSAQWHRRRSSPTWCRGRRCRRAHRRRGARAHKSRESPCLGGQESPAECNRRQLLL